MTKVFISWGLPDKNPVLRLKDRLRQVQVDYFEYTDKMRAGDSIHQRIVDEINQCSTALICVSDRVVERPWVQRELDWAYSAWASVDRPMRALIPVRVGPLADDKIPPLLRETHLHWFDLGDANKFEERLNNLVQDIQWKLGEPVPIVIPATIVAMTKETCELLFQQDTRLEIFQELCMVVGMDFRRAEDRQRVLEQYGEDSAGYAPFPEQGPIKKIMEDGVEKANIARGRRKRPISLKWYAPEILAKAEPESDYARDHVRQQGHLLVVDALSIISDTTRRYFANIATPDNMSRRAILWVPPYTRHTASLVDLTESAARLEVRLADAFRDWKRELHRSIGFDTSTDVGS